MVRLLFMPYPSASGTWGSTVQLAAIADACRRRGHLPVFHACPPTSARLRAWSFDVVEFEGARPRPVRTPVESFYDVCQALGFDDAAFWARMVRAEAEAIELVRPAAVVSHFRLSRRQEHRGGRPAPRRARARGARRAVRAAGGRLRVDGS
jgi:hypothetical protein